MESYGNKGISYFTPFKMIMILAILHTLKLSMGSTNRAIFESIWLAILKKSKLRLNDNCDFWSEPTHSKNV